MIVIDETYKGELNEGTYIALGSFDGLHLGHMSLINRVVDEALADGVKSMVYTFKNHPLTVAKPEAVPKLLMDNEQKLHLLESSGIDVTAMISFTKGYMMTGPEEFITMLMDKYNAKGIVVGFNYKFGYKNRGNVESLRELSQKYGFKLMVLDAAKMEEAVISSTRIRDLIINGHVKEANAMLFEPFMLRGTVVGGRKIGRKIGFPTANMTYDNKYLIPKIGVYYTNIWVKGKLHRGISSVGYNPTIDEGQKLTIETYILDFNEDIYGEEVRLYFMEYMRGEVKFEGLEALIAQLNKDRDLAAEKELAQLL
ncbi:MAG: bifunctional riboflavin kinase/FAD synthetase [Youngiibacter sp.]|jgi:riboflavin kinase/FMN adenylyltransferase|nr:bifunctional riboflavin kinase/FAD synthetase [Youngiibacter sp.]